MLLMVRAASVITHKIETSLQKKKKKKKKKEIIFKTGIDFLSFSRHFTRVPVRYRDSTIVLY